MVIIHTFIYVITSFFAGLLLISLSSGLITPDGIAFFIRDTMFSDALRQTVWGWAGVVILLSSLSFIVKMFSKVRREKFVTKQTADGDVSITLSAIEDMIKKVLEDKDEISHIKPKVTLTRKGIYVLVKGYLNTEVNLIEFTSDVQTIIKKKLTYLLGEDEQLRINLQIKKLTFSASKDIVEEEPRVPFRNY